jgi:hypothetical protein
MLKKLVAIAVFSVLAAPTLARADGGGGGGAPSEVRQGRISRTESETPAPKVVVCSCPSTDGSSTPTSVQKEPQLTNIDLHPEDYR